jgi:hypothetical protein
MAALQCIDRSAVSLELRVDGQCGLIGVLGSPGCEHERGKTGLARFVG